MAKKFKGKYRSESIRLKNWDYGSDAYYFITICTYGREPVFCDIENKQLKLSEFGILADKFWLEIPNHFHFIKLDEYVIMPDHVHGILEICNCGSGDAINRVPTTTITGGITGKHNPMLHQNLSRVIRWYKGRVSFEIRKLYRDFCWQSRFYDSIIRNDRSLNNIRRYIKDNPKKWTRNE